MDGREYWPEVLTGASWEKLRELKGELGGFVVIGGWAVYLWTGMHKSKDIDIIVDFSDLEILKGRYDLVKNHNLKKYEVKFERFDIDIYVPHYSTFSIPAGDLMDRFSTMTGGYRVLSPEALLVLKQGAEMERRGSIKGEKDAIDICTLLLHSPLDVERYLGILGEYGLEDYRGELRTAISEFDPQNSKMLGMSFKDLQSWRKKFLREL